MAAVLPTVANVGPEGTLRQLLFGPQGPAGSSGPSAQITMPLYLATQQVQSCCSASRRASELGRNHRIAHLASISPAQGCSL